MSPSQHPSKHNETPSQSAATALDNSLNKCFCRATRGHSGLTFDPLDMVNTSHAWPVRHQCVILRVVAKNVSLR